MAARRLRSDAPLPAPDSTGEPAYEPNDGGPSEAASFISGSVAELVPLARRHKLHMLGHLLEMAQLEADEFVQKQLGARHF